MRLLDLVEENDAVRPAPHGLGELAARRLTLDVTPAAREWLALGGFDPLYGARPLRRLVQTAIGDPLARLLLGGEVLDGSHVVVDVDPAGEGLVLTADA